MSHGISMVLVYVTKAANSYQPLGDHSLLFSGHHYAKAVKQSIETEVH